MRELKLLWALALLGSTAHGATTLDARLVTTENRREVGAMFGGWGEQLRSVFTDPRGTLWLVADTGGNALVNPGLTYFRRGKGRWTEEAYQALPHGVQQNTASVLAGGTLFTYGVNVRDHWIAECYLDTRDPGYRACNAITVGGALFKLPIESNYIGAAVSPRGTKVVWWTEVARPGRPGLLRYLYHSGGLWNGPHKMELGGYSDFAYVYAAFRSETEVALAGELYLGTVPTGTYAAGIAQVTLGQDARVSTPFAASPGGAPPSGTRDVWVHPTEGSLHVLAGGNDGRLNYYYKPWNSPWAGHHAPLWTVPKSYRARFLETGDGALRILIGGSGGAGAALGLRILSFGVPGLAPLGATSEQVLPLASSPTGFVYPSAIYVPARGYQTTRLGRAHFALCGEPWAKDNEIWQLTLRPRPQRP